MRVRWLAMQSIILNHFLSVLCFPSNLLSKVCVLMSCGAKAMLYPSAFWREIALWLESGPRHAHCGIYQPCSSSDIWSGMNVQANILMLSQMQCNAAILRGAEFGEDSLSRAGWPANVHVVGETLQLVQCHFRPRHQAWRSWVGMKFRSLDLVRS